MSLPVLTHGFATAVPEMALPWEAAQAPEPDLLVLDEVLAADLGLDVDWLRSDDGVRFLVGGLVPPGSRPVAQAYAGHQFGDYNPRLGDGRALLLGELTAPDGTVHDLHLKGSGRTPFARGGDGLAAVGPMLREVVISRFMHAAGVPTTRALAVVATGSAVQRETVLPGGLLTRVASSHLRVGSVQLARSTGDLDLQRRLVDLAIARHPPSADGAAGLLGAVAAAQAALVAQWMLLGFVHGVMNTDNTTLSGQTIDYGPCAFLEGYDHRAVFSSIDHAGRYAYGNQPGIMQWNLTRLAEALLPVIHDDEDTAVGIATEVLGGFGPSYLRAWRSGLRAKLGADVPDDLADDLLAQLAASRVDWTSFWRDLARLARGDAEPARGRFVDLVAFDAWCARWLALGPDADAMDRVNPVYVPRNERVDEALTAATSGDLAPVLQLLEVLDRPFEERPGLEAYARPSAVDFTAGFQTFCGT